MAGMGALDTGSREIEPHWKKESNYQQYKAQERVIFLLESDYDALLTDNTNLFQCAEDWRVQYEEAHERENELQDKVNALLRELTTARTALAEREAELKIAWDDDAEYQEQQARIIALEAENTRLRAELTEMKGQSNV